MSDETAALPNPGVSAWLSIAFRANQTAITEPRMIYGGHQETGSEIRPVFNVEDRISKSVMMSLGDRGYEVRSVRDDHGRVNGIIIDPRTGFRLGGADPREVEPDAKATLRPRTRVLDRWQGR